MQDDIKKAVDVLKGGGVAIVPTDTLYGVVGQALNPTVVERIHKIKNRSDNKPFIILISSLQDLKTLKIDVDEKTGGFLSSVWPGPVSVILPCVDTDLEYLHNNMGLAIRLPKDEKLLEIIQHTGPLVAPSANPEGMKTASTIGEAKEYFGDSVDFYLDGGLIDGEPSTLVSIVGGEVKVLRQGRRLLP